MESVAAVENEKTTSKTHVHPSKLPLQATRENVPKPNRSRGIDGHGGRRNPQLPGVATPPSSSEHSPAATSSPPQSEELLRTVPKVLRDIADHNKPRAGEELCKRTTHLHRER